MVERMMSSGSPCRRSLACRENLKPILLFATAVIIASAWSISNKAVYDTTSVNAAGQVISFRKPLLATALCFLGQIILCLPWYLIQTVLAWRQRQRVSLTSTSSLPSSSSSSSSKMLTTGEERCDGHNTPPSTPSLQLSPSDDDHPASNMDVTPSSSHGTVSLDITAAASTDVVDKEQAGAHRKGGGFCRYFFRPQSFLPLLLASTCDVVGTSIGIIALQFIPASLNALLPAFGIVWVVLFKALFFREVLPLMQYLGVAIIVLSSVVVSLPTLLGSHDQADGWEDPTITGIGIALTIAGSLICSMYMVLAERLFQDGEEEDQIDPAFFAGFTGIWGTLIAVIALSIDACLLNLDGVDLTANSAPSSASITSCAADWDDVEAMIRNSKVLGPLLIVYLIISGFWGLYEAAVLAKLDSIYCNMMFPFRAILVWILSLIIFYGGSPTYGEEWTSLSPLFVVGAVVLAGGIYIYSSYEATEKEQEAGEDEGRRGGPVV